MNKKLIAGLALATTSLLGATSAHALNSCDDPLTSAVGERFCFQKFEDLAPGAYKVSFDYAAENFSGKSDRTLRFGWLFDSTQGPATRGLLSDTTATPGSVNYSFVTQAAGDAGLLFALRGVPGSHYGLELQNLQVTPVPEPATYAMLLAGLGAIVFMGRRRRL